jgi:hypothetical protein
MTHRLIGIEGCSQTARPNDSVLEIRRIRRKINSRLMAANKKGRLDEAIGELECQGEQGLRQAMDRRKDARGRKQE